MMDVVMTVSVKTGVSPFDILKQDFDDFALVVNYFLDHQPDKKPEETKPTTKPKKGNRIRVNDSTATGGWF